MYCVPTIQYYKDSNQQKLSDSVTIEISERFWGSLFTDFMVQMLKTNNLSNISQMLHALKRKTLGTSNEVSDTVFADIFKHHGMQYSIVDKILNNKIIDIDISSSI